VVLLGLVLLAVVFGFARRRGWPPAVRVAAVWVRVRPTVFAYVRGAPATFTYLAVLLVTTWVLLGSSNRVVELLLREHSSNLHQLRIDPVRVLVRSAFWAPGYAVLAWAVLFSVVLAPAERWLGTRRWLVVFVAGHVVATLGTAWALSTAIGHGWAPRRLENSIDVGVSYGFAAVAALFTFRLSGAWRWLWSSALVATAVLALLVGRSFTDAGHLLALGIGYAFAPLAFGEALRARATGPIWAPRRVSPTAPG
jgi:hypothetical protein